MKLINWIAILLFVFFCGVVVTMCYDNLTKEYKYTIQTECFDKFGNEIEGTSCQQDIYCGKIFGAVTIENKIYSCDEDIGFIKYYHKKQINNNAIAVVEK